jgi:hypothetical protein
MCGEIRPGIYSCLNDAQLNMSPPQPESTPHPNCEPPPAGGRRIFARLRSVLAPYKRVGKWLGIVLMMLTAMRSAANHFLPNGISEQVMKVLNPGNQGADGASPITPWWVPTTPMADSGSWSSNAGSNTGNAAADKSVTPSAGSVQLSSRPTSGPGLAPIGSNFSERASVIPDPHWARVPGTGGSAPMISASQPPAKSNHPAGKPSKTTVTSSSAKSTVTATATPAPLGQTTAIGISLVPVDHGYELASGKFFQKTDLVAINSTPQEAYVILGLSGSSSPQPTSSSTSTGELHFSLSAQPSAVPTYSVSGGTLAAQSFAAVPEPAAGGMMAAGVAVLALRRRRAVD